MPTRRRGLTIEELLRSPTRLVDVVHMLRAMLPELPGAGGALGLLVVLAAAEVGLQLALAVAGQQLLAAGASMGRVAGVVVLIAAAFGVTWLRQSRQEATALRWQHRCVARLARHIDGAALEDLSAVPMAETRELLMTDAPFLTRFGVETLVQGTVLTVWVLAATGYMVVFAPALLPVLAGVLGLCGLILLWGSRRHLRLTAERFRRLATLSQTARDVVEVDRVLLTRQFGLGERFRAAFLDASAAFVDIATRQGRLTAAVRAGTSLMTAAAFVGLVVIGGWLLGRGGGGADVAGGVSAASGGVLLAALFIVGQLLAAVIAMGDIAGRAAEAATAARRMGVYWPEAEAETGGEAEAPATFGAAAALVARDLVFGYGAADPVVDGAGLRLDRGEVVALTAETGAGKSTLARLLTGLLEPQAGTVEVLDADQRAHPLGALTQTPGAVLYLGPGPIMVTGSLRDNLFLRPGLPAPSADAEAGLAAVRDALRRGDRPLDWDAPLVDAGGSGLSSGQMQLVQLARALHRDPAFVVLDEATSSLDMGTEARVQTAVLPWLRRRLCLVISHRQCPWLAQAGRQCALRAQGVEERGASRE